MALPESQLADVHEQDSNDIALEERLSIVFPEYVSVAAWRKGGSLVNVRLQEDGTGSSTLAQIVTSRVATNTHTAESSVATKAATPATIVVAVVSFSPVPPAILSVDQSDGPSAVDLGDVVCVDSSHREAQRDNGGECASRWMNMQSAKSWEAASQTRGSRVGSQRVRGECCALPTRRQ